MPIHLDAQQWELINGVPDELAIEHLLDDLLHVIDKREVYSCSIRVVDIAESTEFNEKYRNKQGPTNVLSFPFELIPGVETDLLGDLVICGPVVVSEARAQKKSVPMHFSHMVVHGVLHLFGYDHMTTKQAEDMEAIEIEVLKRHGYANPYES